MFGTAPTSNRLQLDPNTPGKHRIRNLRWLFVGVAGLVMLAGMLIGSLALSGTTATAIHAATTAQAWAQAPVPPQPLAPSLACGSASFAPAQSYPVGQSPASVAVGDFNRDGIQDLAA